MNFNLISKCLVTKHCKKYLVGYSVYLNRSPENIFRRFSSCPFPLIASTQDLTSNEKNCNNKSKLLSVYKDGKVSLNDVSSRRRYCINEGPPLRKLPPLMEFPEIVWPSIIKSLRNFILTTFIIKPYFDREFNLPDFIVGSKKAVEVVSAKISEGDLNALSGLVASDAVPDLQKALSKMSLSQRQQISIDKNDMYFSFPYQIGIMFDDEETKPQKRFVEITMVYHTLRGLDAMKSKGEDLPLNVGMLPQYRDSISICNYRFIKEFTKGVESDWTINLLNHFKPSDYIDQ